jgi:hypothetical protein
VQHEVTDKDLPLPAECPEWLPGYENEMAYDKLYESQRQFQAALFHMVGQHQIFDEKTIVPYIEKEQKGVGGFGTIYKVRIEPSHQKLCSLPGVRISFLACEVTCIVTRPNT